MSCDIKSFIKEQMALKGPDGKPLYSPKDIQALILKAQQTGLISPAELRASTGVTSELLTDEEFKELEGFQDRIAKAGKPIRQVLNRDEFKRLKVLVSRAKNSVKVPSETAKLSKVLDALAKEEPTRTVDLIEILDQAIERAEYSGDVAKRNSLVALKEKIQKANDVYKKTGVDWKAIRLTNSKRDKMVEEVILLRGLTALGDKETIEARNKELTAKFVKVQEERVAILSNADLSDEEKQTQLSKNDKERKTLLKELTKLTSKSHKKRMQAYEKRIEFLEKELAKLESTASDQFLTRVLTTVSGIDPEAYVISLRDLRKRELEATDHIKFVSDRFDNLGENDKIVLGYFVAWLGEDFVKEAQVDTYFREVQLTSEGKVKMSGGVPVTVVQETISKEKAMQILERWKQWRKDRAINSPMTATETARVQQILASSDNQTELVGDLDPNAPVRVADNPEQRLKEKVGYQYNPEKTEDRAKAITDLFTFSKRLRYLSSLRSTNGYIPRGWLIGALGKDAQSLAHLFDSAIIDNYELDNPYTEQTVTTLEGRLSALNHMLLNMGVTPAEISLMPEFNDPNLIGNNSRLAAFDLEWDKNTGKIAAASLVLRVNGVTTTTVIYNDKDKKKPWDKETANNFLLKLNELQNSGFKVIGHNTHGADSDFQKLVSTSDNIKLAFTVAARAYDTMLIAFRGGPQTTFSRNFGPSLQNLAKAVGKEYVKALDGGSAYEMWQRNDPRFEVYIQGDSVAVLDIFEGMTKVAASGTPISVLNDKNKNEEEINLSELVPMWYDTGRPQGGRHPRYAGIHHLFDIIGFRNLREIGNSNPISNVGYDIAQLQNIVTGIIADLLGTDNPEQLDSLVGMVNAREKDVIKAIDKALRISRENHKAYLPILQELRRRNGNAFLLTPQSVKGQTEYSTTDRDDEYESLVIQEIMDMVRASKRNVNKTAARFAAKIGFRQMTVDDEQDIQLYLRDLFNFASNQFNSEEMRDGKEISIVDYGNGNFDYVSATQLGRGFAQIMVGSVEDGLNLTEDINTPLDALDFIRQDADKQYDPTNLDEDIQNREFLPITKNNVAFFAPVSHYEQERAYNDFALIQRYRHIMKRDLTPSDIANWKAFVAENQIVTFRSKIADLQKELNELRKQVKEVAEDKKDEVKAKLEAVHGSLVKIKEEFTAYLESLEEGRLERGRTQLYWTRNPVNNKDLYTRIPTAEESIEMSLEVSLDLPALAAVFVHDSRTMRKDSQAFLGGQVYLDNLAATVGGPTGATTLESVYPAIAHYMQNPILTTEVVVQSLANGYRLLKEGKAYRSNSTYFDDSYNGLHHLKILEMTYFPDPEENEDSLEETLLSLGNLQTQEERTDYYNKVFVGFENALRDHIDSLQKTTGTEAELRVAQQLLDVLNEPGAKTRNFIKGAVIPVIYSGGAPGIIKQLNAKIREANTVTDPISTLNNAHSELVANLLVRSTAAQRVRLIDRLLGLNPALQSKLAEVIVQRSNKNIKEVRARWDRILATSTLASDSIKLPLIEKAIDERLRYIAELTVPGNIKGRERLDWIENRIKLLRTKWAGRIKEALEFVKNNGGSLDFNSETERTFHVILAGGEQVFKQQMNLRFINNAQNTPLTLENGNRELLEASVRTGRLVTNNDVYLAGHVLYSHVGLGTSTGRAQYIGNYGTNLQGTSLSKANRLVVDKDGVIDWDDTVNASMWSITKHPLYGKTREEARKFIETAAIRSWLLEIATDYPPTMIGYDPNTESRSEFFNNWKDRSQKESEYDYLQRFQDSRRLKEIVEKERGVTFTDEEWEADVVSTISSYSTPIDRRIGTRILAPSALEGGEPNVMSNTDAKGLAAFRPRLADLKFEDRIVSGLYNIYKESQKKAIGQSRIVSRNVTRKTQGLTASDILKMDQSKGSEYDPETMGIYFPEAPTSLVEELVGVDNTTLQKANKRKYVLETFALKYGLTSLVKSGNYVQLHQIYRVRKAMEKFAKMISDRQLSYKELRRYHRALMTELFNITRAVRDAGGAERNLTDFSKSVQIDPTQFRYEDGSNLRWLDALLALQKLGIPELDSLTISMYPSEFQTTSTEVQDVLKKEITRTKPFIVQGRDVADLITGVWADSRVKTIATEYFENLLKTGEISSIQYDETGKYVLLSSVPEAHAKKILDLVLDNDELYMAVAENLGFYATLTVFKGDVYLKLQNLKPHAETSGALLVERPGVGMPSVNRTMVGETDVGFLLTPEAIKQMLQGARNSPTLTQIEVSSQVDKLLGGKTYVDQLRRERYADYYETHREALAEETDLLDILMDGDLKRKGTTRLRDELGLELNLYDSFYYWTKPIPELGNRTVFQAAMSLDLIAAEERAKEYPAVSREAKAMKPFYEMVDDRNYKTENFLALFTIFIKNNVARELSQSDLRAILRDHAGDAYDDNAKVDEIIERANTIQTEFLDRINFMPFSFKNRFMSLAFKELQDPIFETTFTNPENEVEEYREKIGQMLKIHSHLLLTDKDRKDFIEAFVTAKRILDSYKGAPETFKEVPDDLLLGISKDPDAFAEAFPIEGMRINNEIQTLIDTGVIEPAAGDFYRLLVAKILKHNPNLAPMLSIVAADLTENMAAQAEKDGGKFTIKVNPKAMQKMGTSDQVRIFAHEMAHIARLAFIKDGSPEFAKIVSLLKSKRGKVAVQTILLALNGGKKYAGFEQELAYYLDNPEEFVAQLGGWMLIHKTFGHNKMHFFDRSPVAHAIVEHYYTAFYQIRHQVFGIGAGLSDLDLDTYEDILEITEALYGFGTDKERQIYIENQNQQLHIIEDFNPIATEAEITELRDLEARIPGGPPLTPAEETRRLVLENQISRAPNTSNVENRLFNIRMSSNRLLELRAEREAAHNPTRSAFLGADVDPKWSMPVLLSPEGQEKRREVLFTFFNRALEDMGHISRDTGTLGGLSRRVIGSTVGGVRSLFPINSVDRTAYARAFGERTAVNLIDLMSALFTFKHNQSHLTYQSRIALIGALTHVYSSSISKVDSQYVADRGSRSIVENRFFTKQWVKRIADQVDELRYIATSEENLQDMLRESALFAAAIPSTRIATFTPEQQAAIRSMGAALDANSQLFRDFIHGRRSRRQREQIITQFNRRRFGWLVQDTPEVRREVRTNKETLLTEIARMSQDKLLSGNSITSSVLFLGRIAPQIYGQYDAVNFRTAWTNSSVAAQDIIIEIATRQYLDRNRGIPENQARNMFAALRLNINRVDIDLAQLRYLFDATHTFYRIVNGAKTYDGLQTAVSQIAYGRGLSGNTGGFTVTDLVNNLRLEVLRVVTANDPALVINNTPSTVAFGTSQSGDGTAVPFGVAGATSETDSEFSDLNTIASEIPGQTLMTHVAALELQRVGTQATFLHEHNLFTGRELLENNTLSNFLSTDFTRIFIDLERSRGFRALSAQSIQHITGLVGYDIYDIIKLIRAELPHLHVPESTRWTLGMGRTPPADELRMSLDVVEEKLNAEQGIRRDESLKQDSSITRGLLKWGPAWVQTQLGGSLNMAATLSENLLTTIVTMRYGRRIADPAQYVWNFLRSVFSKYIGGSYRLARNIYRRRSLRGGVNASLVYSHNRGLAVNMMRSIENATFNPRSVERTELTDDEVRSEGRVAKYLKFKRESDNTVLNSVLEAASMQYQKIFLRHIGNGNLVRLREMFRTVPNITSRDDLVREMRNRNIRGIAPELVLIFKEAGVFERNTIEVLTFLSSDWFRQNSGMRMETEAGLIDINASLSWSERGIPWRTGRMPMPAGAPHAVHVNRQSIYMATRAILRITSEMTSMGSVQNDPLFRDTRDDGASLLRRFWMNFQNLLFANRMKWIGRMGTGTFISMILGIILTDYLYNFLYDMATSWVDWEDLNSFEDFKNYTWKRILSRGSILGATGSLIGTVVVAIYDILTGATKNDSVKKTLLQQVVFGAPIPVQKLLDIPELLFKLYHTKQTRHPGDNWDVTQQLFDLLLRLTPILDQVIYREEIANKATEKLMGPKPSWNRIQPLQPEQPSTPKAKVPKPKITPRTTSEAKPTNILKPIEPPDALFA